MIAEAALELCFARSKFRSANDSSGKSIGCSLHDCFDYHRLHGQDEDAMEDYSIVLLDHK
jgi:hypothetical protein